MGKHDDEEVVVIERDGGSVAPFLWGLAAGAVLGLLFAPMSGRELRSEITTRGRRLKDMAVDKAEELEEMVVEGYTRARDRAQEKFDDARDKVQGTRQYARDVVDAGRSAAGSAREELERRLAEAREARRGGRTSGSEESGA